MVESNENRRSEKAANSDRWVKIGFIVVTVVVAAVVWKYFQTETFMKGWPEDLNAALADANQTNRRVLAVFISNPPNEEATRNAGILAKPQNQRAIQEGRFARVKVTVNSLDSELARRYKLTRLPTMLILDPDGKELNRREGIVGEVPFAQEFLNLKVIEGPAAEGKQVN